MTRQRVATLAGIAVAAAFAMLGAALPTVAQPSSSCPISLGRQVESIRAFSKMMPVFRHPRCMNCHGGMDPMSQAHPGADQISPNDDPAAFIEQCQEACHDRLPGWKQPGSPVFFVDKSDEELCLQMKRFEKTAHDFVEHIRIDHDASKTQFIAAGFAGDRALGVQGLRDYSLVAEPPPGTQAGLVTKAREWVEILGEGYESSKPCGCVIQIKGKFSYTNTSGRDTIKVTGDLIWKPGDDESPSSPPAGDAKPMKFVPKGGQITVEMEFENPGAEGLSVCKGSGRKTFPFSSLRTGSFKFMTLEIAGDDTYRVQLDMLDVPDPFPPWSFDGTCTFPNATSTRKVDVRHVGVALGKHQGTIDEKRGIVGQLATPIRRGPRTITGNWSFEAQDPPAE
jgi:hypothetical protein